jgi:hypothetical protein
VRVNGSCVHGLRGLRRIILHRAPNVCHGGVCRGPVVHGTQCRAAVQPVHNLRVLAISRIESIER